MKRRDILLAVGGAALGGASLGQTLPAMRQLPSGAGSEVARFLAEVRNWGLPGAGPVGSPLRLVEFFDYHCPFCRAMEPLLTALRRDNPDLRMIFAEYPILAPDSRIASALALAAARQRKYLPAHRWLMRMRGRYSEATAIPLAAAIGADADRLRRDMAAPAIAALLDRIGFAGASMALQGTPALVSARGVVDGYVPPAALTALVRDLRGGTGPRRA
ncbi:MAG: DsbA family protein [Rhodospirillales bacterium]|nr:DsbA family protein [Rhodospirillales bacterium]